MANSPGGGGGAYLPVYKDPYFSPTAKPGKKKSKSKGSSKAKAKASYAASKPGINPGISGGSNFLLDALARAGVSGQSGGTLQHQVFGQSSPYAAAGGSNRPVTYGDIVPQTNPLIAMMQKAGIPPASGGGEAYNPMTSGGYGAGKPGGSAYNASVPHGTIPASLNAPATGLGGIAAGAAAGAAGGAGNPPRPKTPEELLAELTQGYPGGKTDWNALAAKIYDPQVDYLNEIEARAKKRAAASGKAITGVYGALGKDIAGQAAGIKSDYLAADKESDAAYQQAMSQTQAGFDDSRNGTAETLQRLGIEEAAPNAVNSDMQGLMQSIIATQDQAQDNLLTAGKQSDLGYNQAMVSGSALKGGDAQYGLSTQLNQFLNDLGLKRADLATQMAQYAAQGQSTGDQQAYERWRDQRDFKYKAGYDAQQLAAQAQDATGAGGSASIPDLNKLDPIGQLNAIATNLYPNPQAAANAVRAITDTVDPTKGNYNPQGKSLQEFVAQVVARNPQADHPGGDVAALIQLANTYWERFNNRVTPDPLASMGG